MNLERTTFFSPDYATARSRFRRAAHAAGAALEALALDARGPQGEPLTIDLAWIGAQPARRVVLHTSGLHGVEAFAGSAIQLAALARLPAVPAACALVFAHVLNPYGMAWTRRANENNVDLNRNFLEPGESYDGAPGLYARIDPVLNPPSPPRFDFFYLKALALVMRYGVPALKQAIAEGQYEYPRGLFYGGKSLEQGPQLYLDWLRRALSQAQYVLALDTHTGLGKWGKDMLIVAPGARATALPDLEQALGRTLVDTTRDASSAYVVRGGMGSVLPHALPGARVDYVLQELGTYPAHTVLSALREENRLHHHGPRTPDHPAKRALREALFPSSERWRAAALRLGLGLLQRAAAWRFAND